MNLIRDMLNRKLVYVIRLLEVAVVGVWIVAQFATGLGDWLAHRGLIDLVALLLVAELAILAAKARKQSAQPLALLEDQVQATQELLHHVERMEPSVAKLIGLSGGKREDILNSLTRSGWKIRLLAQHPEAAMNEVLRDHLKEKLKELNDITFGKHKDTVEFRLYRRPCFLRGTKIGESLVALGWYACGEGQYGLFGHRNPIVRGANGEAECLRRFFDDAFDYLWDHEDTIPFGEYLKDSR